MGTNTTNEEIDNEMLMDIKQNWDTVWFIITRAEIRQPIQLSNIINVITIIGTFRDIHKPLFLSQF